MCHLFAPRSEKKSSIHSLQAVKCRSNKIYYESNIENLMVYGRAFEFRRTNGGSNNGNSVSNTFDFQRFYERLNRNVCRVYYSFQIPALSDFAFISPSACLSSSFSFFSPALSFTLILCKCIIISCFKRSIFVGIVLISFQR